MSDNFENLTNNFQNNEQPANAQPAEAAEEIKAAAPVQQNPVTETAPTINEAPVTVRPEVIAQPTQQYEVNVQPIQTANPENTFNGVSQPVVTAQVYTPVNEQPKQEPYTQPNAQATVFVNPVAAVSDKPPFSAQQTYQAPDMQYTQQPVYQQQPINTQPAVQSQTVQPTVQQPMQTSQPYYGTVSPIQHSSQQTAYQAATTAYSDNSNKEKPKKQKRGIGKAAVAVLVIVGLICSGGLGFGGGLLAMKYADVSGSSAHTSGDLNIKKVEDTAGTGTAVSSSDNLSVTEITNMVADSVVEITTEVVTTGRFSQQYISEGAGSGVIISEDGYIITNNHVISGANTISVSLRDGTSYKATIIGADSVVDIALLKIDAKGLTTAVFGDSSKIQVGDMSVVIGNPLGQLGGTVTDGIISALNRDIVIDDNTMNLLQTNAAINPGNSGGGLFDGRGKLIGIIVAKSSGTDVEGLGFAIPINDVVDILGDLKKYGYVTGRIEMGMSLLDVTSEQMAWMYGVSDIGVYVYSVTNGSKAAEVGFKPGDYIKTFDGQEVKTADDIQKILDNHKVGDKVDITFVRRRQQYTLTLELEEYTPNIIGKTEDTGNFSDDSNRNYGSSEAYDGFGGFDIFDFFSN